MFNLFSWQSKDNDKIKSKKQKCFINGKIGNSHRVVPKGFECPEFSQDCDFHHQQGFTNYMLI